MLLARPRSLAEVLRRDGSAQAVPTPPAVPLGLQVLTEWINATLLPEHIVVRSLEEDMFDGLVLHHLFREPRPTWPPASVPRRDSCPALR